MKVVVAHRGARDAYQVALGLQEAGLLDRLVTDLYWPAGRGWAQKIERQAGQAVTSALRARTDTSLNPALVETCTVSGLTSLAFDKFKRSPFAFRRLATRATDAAIGNAAGRRPSAQTARF